MTHKHVLASGWIRDGQTFRECVQCRQVVGSGKLWKSDYYYYRNMSIYWGNKNAT
jgi:hypothetical protein